MGFKLKNIVRAVTAPVVAPVQAVAKIAQGENVIKSVEQAVGKVTASGTALFNEATGGQVAQAVQNVPVVGSSASSMLTQSSQIIRDDNPNTQLLKSFGFNTLKTGAIIGGIAAAPSALGITSTQAAGGTLVGSKLLKGETQPLFDLASGLTGVPVSDFLPKFSGGGEVGFPTPSELLSPEEAAKAPLIAKKSGVSSVGYIAIGGVLILAFLLAKRKK